MPEVENGFCGDFFVTLTVCLIVRARSLQRAKKCRRWQLFWVANYNGSSCTYQRADRVLWAHLRRFVNHHQIEQIPLLGQHSARAGSALDLTSRA